MSESGAPRGEKFFLFVNPPVVNQQLGIRRSYLAETRRIAAEFLKRQLQLIVFAQSRLTTEILTTYLKDDFGGQPGTQDQIRGYRGGYLPQRRREIEKGLREGSVRAVVSTNALELGIDIGALDVCVMAGYPGTIAATWQRAGRAGRRSGRSAAVLVASSAPLDQFVVRNPSYFFDATPEHALINPDNLHILVDHVKCAAFELPFTTSEEYGKQNVQDVLGVLDESGIVHRTGDGDDGTWQWTNESYPADAVSLRSISSDNFVVVDTTNGADVIGETSFNSGPPTLHEKAIYIIEGALYRPFGVDALGGNQVRGAADEHRIVEHQQLRVEDRGEVRPLQLGDAPSDLQQLLVRANARTLERGKLARHAIRRDRKPDDLRPLNRHESRADRRPRRDADALQAFHDSSPNPDATSSISESTAFASSGPSALMTRVVPRAAARSRMPMMLLPSITFESRVTLICDVKRVAR